MVRRKLIFESLVVGPCFAFAASPPPSPPPLPLSPRTPSLLKTLNCIPDGQDEWTPLNQRVAPLTIFTTAMCETPAPNLPSLSFLYFPILIVFPLTILLLVPTNFRSIPLTVRHHRVHVSLVFQEAGRGENSSPAEQAKRALLTTPHSAQGKHMRGGVVFPFFLMVKRARRRGRVGSHRLQ